MNLFEIYWLWFVRSLHRLQRVFITFIAFNHFKWFKTKRFVAVYMCLNVISMRCLQVQLTCKFRRNRTTDTYTNVDKNRDR